MIKLNWIVILAIIVLLVLLYLNNKEHFAGSSSSTSSSTLNTEAIQNISSLYNTNDLSATNLKAQNTLKVGNNTIITDGESIPDKTKGISFLNSNNKPMAAILMKEENGIPVDGALHMRGDILGVSFRLVDFPADSYIRHERGGPGENGAPDKFSGLSISTVNNGELKVGGADYDDNKYRQNNRPATRRGKQILQWDDKGIKVTGDINLTGKINHNKIIEEKVTISTTESGVPFINYADKTFDGNYTTPPIGPGNWVNGPSGETMDLKKCQDQLGKLRKNYIIKAYAHEDGKCYLSYNTTKGFYDSTGNNAGIML
jgi:hypothetical protein